MQTLDKECAFALSAVGSHRSVLIKQGSLVIWFILFKKIFLVAMNHLGRPFLSSRPEVVAAWARALQWVADDAL